MACFPFADLNEGGKPFVRVAEKSKASPLIFFDVFRHREKVPRDVRIAHAYSS